MYCSIVQQTHNGVELYVRQFNEMIGMTFGEIRRRFDTAVIVGFMAKAGELNINPADDKKMPEGARLVALADDGRLILSQLTLHLLLPLLTRIGKHQPGKLNAANDERCMKALVGGAHR